MKHCKEWNFLCELSLPSIKLNGQLYILDYHHLQSFSTTHLEKDDKRWQKQRRMRRSLLTGITNQEWGNKNPSRIVWEHSSLNWRKLFSLGIDMDRPKFPDPEATWLGQLFRCGRIQLFQRGKAALLLLRKCWGQITEKPWKIRQKACRKHLKHGGTKWENYWKCWKQWKIEWTSDEHMNKQN